MSEEHRLVRQYLLEELRRDLVGPNSVNEELLERPTSRYLTGILYPQNTNIDSEEDQDSADRADSEAGIDEGVLMSTTTNPSAIGLTFAVKPGSTFKVKVGAAVYLERPQDTGPTLWQRQPLTLEPATFIAKGKSPDTPEELTTGLKLMVRFRARPNHIVVTLSLVNTHRVGDDEDQTIYCFFQPQIEITSISEEESIFLTRSQPEHLASDKDRRQNDLLYRHAPEFAVGHGCGTTWEGVRGGRATILRTAIIPDYEILQFSPDPPHTFRAQEMLFLSQALPDELAAELRIMVAAYREWIAELPIADVPETLKDLAEENIAICYQAADRIEEGIRLLVEDATARHAFCLANQAMLLQRARSDWKQWRATERPSEPFLDSSHKWRPFQLVFILLCLPGIVDPEHPSRGLVDLLWFPTGGGKTEAYLGLTAFTVFLRRLRHRDQTGSGVTVLMRYTLRLLTIQQFQRAAILIMACDKIRKENIRELGTAPISLGLWVGGGATPNRLIDARRALDKMKEGEKDIEGNPYQIKNCPWCGGEITLRDYRIEASMFISCGNPTCDFVGDLPVYLVDEDIYSRRPTLLIGTVDKFARLPWLSEVSSLFGGTPPTSLPPELIIQDELHLIAGPLGSLVGLYETAVDLLCIKKGVLPKIIASTATIRRASEQTHALFNRGLAQFPPPAIDARDSFFSVQVSPDEQPGRLYVGVHAPGRSMKTALLRLYAVLLQRISEHRANERVRDPYWTLVGYFNSTRELGGALRLVADDIPKRIRFLASSLGESERNLASVRELYSQVPSGDIPEILSEMDRQLGQPGCLDILLATNMISVGVDVNRLGLMVVTGQPKLSAEYIQATSRVGRRYPGLVITLYNWTRPRDRSHYERFVSYHSAIYSRVEPASVTPFSSRARDRALHAVLIALVRHTIPDMNPEDAAQLFEPTDSKIERLIDQIVERISQVDPDEAAAAREQLQAIARRWETLIRHDRGLLYGQSRRDATQLMKAAEQANLLDEMAFPTLNSLRDVEGEAGISTLLMRSATRRSDVSAI